MSKPSMTRPRPARLRDAGLPALVAAVLADSPEAFGEIVARFQRSAHASAFALLGDAQLAQDAVQEAFLDALLTLRQLRDPAAFPGWFRRIVFKHADRVRRKPRAPIVRFPGASPREDTAPSAEERMLAAEQRAIVGRALDRLPDHERIVVSLFYMGDQSHAEICDFLVLPLSTIKKRLHDARKRLRSDLAPFEVASRAAATAPLGTIHTGPGPPRATGPEPSAARLAKEKPMTVSRIVPLLNVRDVGRSVEFYQQALGFECRSSWKDEGRLRWASLASGDVEIMINESGGAASHADLHDARPARDDFSDCVLYLRVDDANALYERLQRDGFTTSEIFDADYGLREFHMRDFDGYELSITSPLEEPA